MEAEFKLEDHPTGDPILDQKIREWLTWDKVSFHFVWFPDDKLFIH